MQSYFLLTAPKGIAQSVPFSFKSMAKDFNHLREGMSQSAQIQASIRATLWLNGITVESDVLSAAAIPCSEGAFVEIQTTIGAIKTAPMSPPDADKFAEKINATANNSTVT